MSRKMTSFDPSVPGTIRLAAIVVVAVAALSRPQAVQAQSVDAAMMQEMRRIIEQQQSQLNQQSQTIEALNGRLDQLEQQTSQAQATATEAESTAREAVSTAQQASTGASSDAIVTSGGDKVKLSISGHTNRAMNIVDDGDQADVYFVDNDTSNTRVRFVGTAEVRESTTMGTTLELGFSPDNSYDVSQESETADDFTDVRKAEAFVRDDAYGMLSFGKGAAAADDTAEHDLSLVAGPIMYSGIADIAGGMQFTADGDLSGVSVGDAFFNFDGDRQSRVRYDSPMFGPGVQVSASAGSDGRFDGAILWGSNYGDWSGVDAGTFTTLGALSIRDPDQGDIDYRLAGSFSALHNPSGASVTVSGGMDKLDDDDDGDDPYNLYAKLGWDTRIFSIGQTGFGVDVTYSENVSGDGDEGLGFGLAAVQLIENFGTELYAQVRMYDVDRDTGEDFDEIYVGTVGARVKF